ncbi:efflux RND transporter permease subunit [Indioceanicola profundi]|uniref:efflux RND transporter permease subunit n=1 Tax=Indioceanicola profundi TaxID=2220096 RepID=UPI000E6AC305|nr:efflux RND transporter permease subunit [Indioceanicola profundi]
MTSSPPPQDGGPSGDAGDGFEPGRFNLSAWAIAHRPLVFFLLVAFLVTGALAYLKLGRAEDPPFTLRLMVVSAQWPGATVKEMEELVSDPIERAVQEVPYFYHTRSYSRPGETVVFVYLHDYTRSHLVPESWYQVRKRVGDIRPTLPAGVIGPQFNDEFGDSFGIIYAFQADGFSDTELKTVLLSVRQRLLQVPDVSKIELVGSQPEKIYVEFDSRRLAELGIPPAALMESLQKQNALSTAGVLETGAERIQLRITGALATEEQVREVPVAANGRILRLGDIATVERRAQDPPVLTMRYNGAPVTGLAISMVKGGDILTLGRNIAGEMAAIQAELPHGIEVSLVSDQPTVVDSSIDEFIHVLAEALAIVMLVTFLSLGLRTGVVVALSVPLVLAITFLLMWAGGIDLHKISVGALIIALGLLVDDAIIAVEMMMVKLEQGWERAKAAAFAWTSTAFPMLTGTLITAAGFIPVAFARSAAGEYTGSIFWVVATALMVSWVVAVIFTPYLGFKLLPAVKPESDGKGHGHLYDTPIYRRLRGAVAFSVRRRWTVIGLTLLAFAASLWAFQFVQQQFFPGSARLEVMVDLELPEGSTHAATKIQIERLEKLLQDDPRVTEFVSYVGGGGPRFYLPLNQELRRPNFGQVVALTGRLEDTVSLFHDLRGRLDQHFPEIRTRVSRLENGPPVGYPVQFRVIGHDHEEVRRVAARVRDVMRANPHTRDVNFDWWEKVKSIRLELDQARIRELGITPQDLAFATSTVLTGFTATQYREGTELIDVVLRADEGERTALERLADIQVRTGNGRAVPLSQIARIGYELEDGLVWRRSRETTLTVRADTAGVIQAPVVSAQIAEALAPVRAQLPSGFRIETGGAVEESLKGQSSIVKVVPAMIVVWLVVLMVQLQSFQRVVLVFLTAPLGLIGVVLALLAFQTPFGFVAQLGVIALFGMIMRNSVILVDQIEQDIAAGHARFDAVVDATVRRARPILLTAAAAVLAMIPLSRSIFWGPMAIAIMGGLIVATVLTLFSLPAMYAAWFRIRPDAMRLDGQRSEDRHRAAAE